MLFPTLKIWGLWGRELGGRGGRCEQLKSCFTEFNNSYTHSYLSLFVSVDVFVVCFLKNAGCQSYFCFRLGTAEPEINNRPPTPLPLGGSPGLSKVPSFSAWSWNITLHNMLCLLQGPLTQSCLHVRFILLYFLQTLSSKRLRTVSNCEITLT